MDGERTIKLIMDDSFLIVTVAYYPTLREYEIGGISLVNEEPVIIQGERAGIILDILAKGEHTTKEEMFSHSKYPEDIIVSIKEMLIDDDFDTDDSS